MTGPDRAEGTAVLSDEEREARGVLCPSCGHRVKWHHDERGCDYHGAGPHRCPCRYDSDTAARAALPGTADTGAREAVETAEQAAERIYNHGGYHGSPAAIEDAMRAFIHGAKWAALAASPDGHQHAAAES